MITSLEGEEATGKTATAYTAPLKIVGFQFDLGWERALKGAMYEQWFKGLTIEEVPYGAAKPPYAQYWAQADICIFMLPIPVQIDSTQVRGVRELWDYFLSIVGEAIRDPLVRTLVVDTMTLARKAKSDAYLQALQEVEKTKSRTKLLQIEYGAPNSAIRDLYNAINAVQKNLVAVHHMTDEYVQVTNSKGERERERSGRRVLEGLDQTYRFVDLAIRMEKQQGKLAGKVLKCGYNLELEGLSLPNPTWDMLVDTVERTLGGRIKFERRQEK